ncbi:MAG: STT3 domain-containing protein [Vulcanisaeta sp.]|uniref:STT3 domain-containing protein n=1 Tax=Vulcanisaeta sp. TaxID=2020871 RepID=UPI003D105C1C
MSKAKAVSKAKMESITQVVPTVPLDVRVTQWVAMLSAVVSFTLLAYYLRLYPVLLYGWYINEFDPYIRLFMTEQMLKYGTIKGLLWWLHKGYGALFTHFWYPWGVNWTVVLSPGVSWFGVLAYKVLSHLGFDLVQSVVLLPAIANAAVVPAMFYLGYRLGGKYVGLLAALWSVFSTMLLQRGTAGWFAAEPLFQFIATLGIAFYIESLIRKDNYWILFAVLSAIFNGITTWVWGSYVFLWNFYGLFTIVILLYLLIRIARRQNLPFTIDKLVITYVLTDLGFSAFVAITPRYGFHTLISGMGGVANVALLFSIIAYALIKLYPRYPRIMVPIIRYFLMAIVVLVVAVIGLSFTSIGGKFLGALAPFARSAIVQSVAEHSPSTLQQSMYNISITIPFMIYTMILSIMSLSLPVILISLGSLVAAYFASSEVWLFMLLGLFWVPAAAYGFVKLTELALNRRIVIGLSLAALLGIILAIALIVNIQPALSMSIMPQQIVSTVTPPIPTPDWLDALQWLSYNTPPNATVLSWWDYGYWIAVIGNRTSLADNSTVNGTQIALIGNFFMSNPYNYTGVLEKLNELHDPQYILIFEPYYIYGPVNMTNYGLGSICILIPEYPAGGDFAKSYWMARIAGYTNNYILNTFIYPAQVGSSTIYVPYANNTFYAAYNVTLYSLMFNSEVVSASYAVWSTCTVNNIPAYWIFEGVPTIMPGASLTSAKLAYIGIPGYNGPTTPWPLLFYPPPWAQLVYVSRPYGWVIIYKVNYSLLNALARNQTLINQ